jgi:GNAT superfamily N-acetyltransferase
MPDAFNIRRLHAGELELHRTLRGRALADAPDSFGETLAQALARSDEDWAALHRSVCDPGPHAMFAAFDAARAVGMAYALIDADDAGASRIGGMWVDPAARGRGVGRALLGAGIAWADAIGRGRIGLWAPAHSASARRLYRDAGFVETGERAPMPGRPALEILRMLRASPPAPVSPPGCSRP